MTSSDKTFHNQINVRMTNEQFIKVMRLAIEADVKPATYVRMLLERAYPEIFSRVDA